MIHKLDPETGSVTLLFKGEETTFRFTNRSIKKATDALPKKEEQSMVDIGYYYIPTILFGSLLAYGGPAVEDLDEVASIYHDLPFNEQEVIEILVGEYQERQNRASKAIIDPEYRKQRLEQILSTDGTKIELQPSK